MTFCGVVKVTLCYFLLFILIPLQINPEFVVRELEACCHHQIHLKCKNLERIAIIQSRYVVSKGKASSTPFLSQRKTDEVWMTPTNPGANNSHLPYLHSSYMTLWDLDLKFSYDFLQSKFIRSDHPNPSLNSPEWARQHRIRSHERRITTPNPFSSGLKFTAQRVLEMPPYGTEKDSGLNLDKETMWGLPLFPIILDESNVGSESHSHGGTTTSGTILSAISRRPNFRHATAGFSLNSGSSGLMTDPLPCISYEALSGTTGSDLEEEGRTTTKRKYPKPQWHYKDLRPVFNRRCSGKTECIVNLLRNKLKDQDLTNVCQKWPDGRILVKYLCFNAFSINVHSKCNEHIASAREGFILNPGYPEIYQGDDNLCQWRLHVEPPQRKILLIFLDISVRGEEKSNCRDKIVISEDEKKLFSTCGDHSSAIGILSHSNRLNVTFTPESRLAFPKRGFLLYYRALGCDEPPLPLHSYLVFRNGSHALFLCEPGYGFLDSMIQYRWIACNSLDHFWQIDDGLLCQETGLNLSMSDSVEVDIAWPSTTNLSNAEIWRDVGVPLILIITLCLTNGLVLLCIQRKKLLVEAEIQNDVNQGVEDQAVADAGLLPMCDISSSPERGESSTFTISSAGGGIEILAQGDRQRPWTGYRDVDLVDTSTDILVLRNDRGGIIRIPVWTEEDLDLPKPNVGPTKRLSHLGHSNGDDEVNGRGVNRGFDPIDDNVIRSTTIPTVLVPNPLSYYASSLPTTRVLRQPRSTPV